MLRERRKHNEHKECLGYCAISEKQAGARRQEDKTGHRDQDIYREGEQKEEVSASTAVRQKPAQHCSAVMLQQQERKGKRHHQGKWEGLKQQGGGSNREKKGV